MTARKIIIDTNGEDGKKVIGRKFPGNKSRAQKRGKKQGGANGLKK